MELLEVDREIAARWGQEDLDEIAAATGVSWPEVAYRARRLGCRPVWRFYAADRCYQALGLARRHVQALDRLTLIVKPQKPAARVLDWAALADYLAGLSPDDLSQADPYFLDELEETTGVDLPRWHDVKAGPRMRVSPLGA